MFKISGWILAFLAALAIFAVLAGQIGLLSGTPPKDLGVQAGRLKGLSATRNSVSSQADLYPGHPMQGYAYIEPLPLQGRDQVTSLARLVTVLENMGGITVVERRDDYVYAQARTRVMGFVDDLEFAFNPKKNAWDVRSASRLGKEDFAANRNRVEAIRAAYLRP